MHPERLAPFLGVGKDPRYIPSITFPTFPFPQGLTPDIPAAAGAQAIAVAAERSNEPRENWQTRSDLVRRVPEVVPGYLDRILPVDDKVERELKKRTLTNLYNARAVWLAHVDADLDAAVADAYGWGDDWRAGLLSDDEILTRLFRLNQTRAAAQGGWGAMYGRFISPNLRGTELELSQIKIDPFPRRFNIEPTQDVLVVPPAPLDPLARGAPPCAMRGRAGTHLRQMVEARRRGAGRARLLPHRGRGWGPLLDLRPGRRRVPGHRIAPLVPAPGVRMTGPAYVSLNRAGFAGG